MLPGAGPQPDFYTVLVTSGGHAYTKRLATDHSDPEVAEALAANGFTAAGPPEHLGGAGKLAGGAVQPLGAARKLAQAGISQSVGAVTASTDLGCDGCSTTDIRVQVRGPLR